eukprot:COSAG01_NODE_11791_length_1858_cov_2.484935_2_plen_165_part_00
MTEKLAWNGNPVALKVSQRAPMIVPTTQQMIVIVGWRAQKLHFPTLVESIATPSSQHASIKPASASEPKLSNGISARSVGAVPLGTHQNASAPDREKLSPLMSQLAKSLTHPSFLPIWLKAGVSVQPGIGGLGGLAISFANSEHVLQSWLSPIGLPEQSECFQI